MCHKDQQLFDLQLISEIDLFDYSDQNFVYIVQTYPLNRSNFSGSELDILSSKTE